MARAQACRMGSEADAEADAERIEIAHDRFDRAPLAGPLDVVTAHMAVDAERLAAR